MSTFALNRIDSISGKQLFYELIIDGKSQFISNTLAKLLYIGDIRIVNKKTFGNSDQ